MSGINKVIILGRLGNDPAISKGVARISVATSERWKDKDSGDMHEKTEWHRIVFFGKLADIAEKYLAKGSQVYIEGKLQTSKYSKDGIDRYSTDIIADKLQMLDSKPKEGEYVKPATQHVPSSQAADDAFDSDIPF